MSLVPDARVGKIEFYENHLEPWRQHAAALGLSPEQVATQQTLVAEARAAWHEQQQAIQAARAATQRFYQKVAALHGHGADLLRTIRNRAHSTNAVSYTHLTLPTIYSV